MPASYTLLGIGLFGLIFTVSGTISIVRREITFRYRRGTIKPVFVGTLQGICALTYGVFSIVGGAFMILPLIYTAVLKNNVANGVITFLAAIGVGIFIVGLIFSSVMQVLLDRERTNTLSTEKVSSREESTL
jgi:hypothetical protein